VTIIFAAVNGFLDDLPTESLARFETEIFAFMDKEFPEVGHAIASTKQLDEKTESRLKEAILQFKTRFDSHLGAKS
jgi:F-type H+-transporting ATPase subunit alpha